MTLKSHLSLNKGDLELIFSYTELKVLLNDLITNTCPHTHSSPLRPDYASTHTPFNTHLLRSSLTESFNCGEYKDNTVQEPDPNS